MKNLAREEKGSGWTSESFHFTFVCSTLKQNLTVRCLGFFKPIYLFYEQIQTVTVFTVLLLKAEKSKNEIKTSETKKMKYTNNERLLNTTRRRKYCDGQFNKNKINGDTVFK